MATGLSAAVPFATFALRSSVGASCAMLASLILRKGGFLPGYWRRAESSGAVLSNGRGDGSPPVNSNTAEAVNAVPRSADTALGSSQSSGPSTRQRRRSGADNGPAHPPLNGQKVHLLCIADRADIGVAMRGSCLERYCSFYGCEWPAITTWCRATVFVIVQQTANRKAGVEIVIDSQPTLPVVACLVAAFSLLGVAQVASQARCHMPLLVGISVRNAVHHRRSHLFHLHSIFISPSPLPRSLPRVASAAAPELSQMPAYRILW